MRRSLLHCIVLFGLLMVTVGCGNLVYNIDNRLTTGSIAPIDDQTKAAFLKTYAPRVYFHSKEEYWPSSVEWSFNFLKRVWDPGNGKWRLVSKHKLKKPSSIVAYFHGADPNRQWTDIPCSLDDVPAYAFWHKVNDRNYDLLYFFYYPYNRGKGIKRVGLGKLLVIPFHTVFGNHVGDWEHITVRLTWQKVWGKWYLIPSMDAEVPSLYLASHSHGQRWRWPVRRVPDTHHPIIYAAKGSHGCYLKVGSHTYKSHFITGKLTDHTDKGTAWDTWNKLECFDYDAKQGLGPTWKGNWPTWLKKDTGDRNVGNENPASGPVWRWGNYQRGKIAGQYRLTDGPTGPADKPYLRTQALD